MKEEKRKPRYSEGDKVLVNIAVDDPNVKVHLRGDSSKRNPFHGEVSRLAGYEKGEPFYDVYLPDVGYSTLKKEGEMSPASRWGGLLSRLGLTVVLFLCLGSFFLFNGMTGNTIANMNSSTTIGVGGILLALGLIAGFFSLKIRKK